MRIPFYFILILSLCIIDGCSKNVEKQNIPNYNLISYGFSGVNIDGINYNLDKSDAFQEVSEKWKIKFSSVGCVVNDSILNFIKENNREANRNIELKYGSDWKLKFNDEVEKTRLSKRMNRAR